MQKPNPTEYNPYFQRYIDHVKDGDFFQLFRENTEATVAFFAALPPEKHAYRYAENKWTIKQMLLHILDTERIFMYRALVCARGDRETQLQSYDENFYADNAPATNRSMESLLEEFKTLRRSSEIFFETLSAEESQRTAAVGERLLSARAVGYIFIGHVLHHIGVVKERYL